VKWQIELAAKGAERPSFGCLLPTINLEYPFIFEGRIDGNLLGGLIFKAVDRIGSDVGGLVPLFCRLDAAIFLLHQHEAEHNYALGIHKMWFDSLAQSFNPPWAYGL
jgi:hypothetical protein